MSPVNLNSTLQEIGAARGHKGVVPQLLTLLEVWPNVIRATDGFVPRQVGIAWTSPREGVWKGRWLLLAGMEGVSQATEAGWRCWL